MQWQIYCSWPVSALNPESQCPPGRRKCAEIEQKSEALLLTARAINHDGRTRLQQAKVKLVLQLIRPNGRYRDEMQMIESTRHVVVGIAEALGMNQDQFSVEHDFTPEPVKPGGIRVTIGDLK